MEFQTTSNTDRRTALQHLATAFIGAGLLSAVGCKSEGSTQSDTTSLATTPATRPALQPFYLPPAAPLDPGPGGLNIRTWVRSSQTNLQFSCVEAAVAPKKMGPAPHVHKELDEICYVLEGTATVLVEDEVLEIPTGGFHLRPHGIPHTFWNGTDKPLRFMDLYLNQNFEDFLEELFFQIIPDMVKGNLPPTDSGIAKRMADLDARFGITTFHEQRQPIIDKYKLIG